MESLWVEKILKLMHETPWIRTMGEGFSQSFLFFKKQNKKLFMFRGYHCWRKRRINECDGTLFVQCCKRTFPWGNSSKWSLEHANAVWHWTSHKSTKASLSNLNIFLLRKPNNKNLSIRGLLHTLADLTYKSHTTPLLGCPQELQGSQNKQLSFLVWCAKIQSKTTLKTPQKWRNDQKFSKLGTFFTQLVSAWEISAHFHY